MSVVIMLHQQIVCNAILQHTYCPEHFLQIFPIKVSASKMKLTLRFQGNKSADN